MNKFSSITLIGVLCAGSAWAQSPKTSYTDFENDTLQLNTVEVSAQNGSRIKMDLTSNTELIGQAQLVRAACCNLGESFTTNPSVDVAYSDAATGARQIKLLGLSGTYVQMLTENVPNLRGAAIPYGLGYIPGPWMQSIQVSKGASSVKNGYESTTGQINIEYLKPQATDGVRGNFYYDNQQKFEGNLDGSIHLNEKLSTSLLLHYEDRQKSHDGNGDGFIDMPKQKQYNVMNRWAWVSPKFISQLYARVLGEKRESGQHDWMANGGNPYKINLITNRLEAQWKNAFILDPAHSSSIALMLHGVVHDSDQQFGLRNYDITQFERYAQLMYETDLTPEHNLSIGASANYDRLEEIFYNPLNSSYLEQIHAQNDTLQETTAGFYAQYTYKLGDMLTVMAGIRWDHSSLYGGFWTPRLHIRYAPNETLSLRASAGKGYRTPHALAENSPLLASGRYLSNWNGKSEKLKQEEAWNYGVSASMNIPIGDKNLELNGEYYYTHFINQMVTNVVVRDNRPTPDYGTFTPYVSFENLSGKSYSHTIQIDATYPLCEGLSATAAWRFNDVQCTYNGELRRKPLTSRYKGLLTLSYVTPLEFWHFDVTAQLIGKGELYDGTRYHSYGQLQAQITREFRYFDLYIGGENLSGYKKRQILNADAPYSSHFDATQIYAPMEGAMGYAGIRFKWEK